MRYRLSRKINTKRNKFRKIRSSWNSRYELKQDECNSTVNFRFYVKVVIRQNEIQYVTYSIYTVQERKNTRHRKKRINKGNDLRRRISSPRTKLLAARCEWCMSILSSNHNAKPFILIRCKHSQSFVRGLENRL
jgi:hypothetical protein